MAVTSVTTAMAGAINYTVVTDTSADWPSVANSTYFYDKADKLVHFKNASGTVLEIFSTSGGTNSLKGVHALIPLASNDITFLQVGGSNMTQTALVSNRITLSPFIPNQDITTSTLDITLNSAQANSNARILIYSNLNGLPDSKIYESATLDLTTTNGIKTAITTQTFIAGTTYWIGVHASGGASLSAMNTGMMFPINIIGTTSNTVIYKDVTFGSAPANFGVATGYLNLAMYLIRITKA